MATVLTVEPHSSTFRPPQLQFMADLMLSPAVQDGHAQQDDTGHAIPASNRAVLQPPTTHHHPHSTAHQLLTCIEPAHPDTANQIVLARFLSDATLRILPVVKNGVPLGIINRNLFLGRLEHHPERERLGTRPCQEQMQTEPLLVEKNLPIEELSQFLAAADSRHFADGFIITAQGRYIGVACGQELLRELARMHLEASRHANPLTLLPGQVPVNRRIEQLLQSRTGFVACYGNLGHFKPFNEIYGYRKGDEMIQLTGRLLNWACDPKLDFIGHTGGDDFILLMQSRDWKARCENALDSFAQASSLLFNEAHLERGGYHRAARDGSSSFHPLTSLSIGAIKVSPRQFGSFHEVCAAMGEAGEMAKKMTGNSLFVEKSRSLAQS